MLRILYCSEKLFLMKTFSSLEMVEALGNTDDYLHAGLGIIQTDIEYCSFSNSATQRILY